MELLFDDVRARLYERHIEIGDTAIASALAALNAGNHVALVADQTSHERASAFAELLADSAAALSYCIGWLNLYAAAGALVSLRDVVNPRFLADVWLIVIDPSPVAISRVVDEVRDLWHESDARLVVATSSQRLRGADLDPAARRALVRVLL